MTVKFAMCRHCGRMLWRIHDEPEKWIHLLPDRSFWGSVHCRQHPLNSWGTGMTP